MTRAQHIRGVLCVGTLVGFCALWVAELILLLAFPSHSLGATHTAEALGLAAAEFCIGRNWQSN